MSTNYGINSKLITSDDIFQIRHDGIEIVSSGNHPTKGFEISWYSTRFGCGEPEMRFFMDLKETYPRWSNLTYRVDYLTTTTCWWFNQEAVANNILTFNTGLDDLYLKPKNCFELPQFLVEASACNNNANNAFRVSVGGTKSFYTKRRRNMAATGFAGPAIYFSCCPTGSAHVCTVSQIFIY